MPPCWRAVHVCRGQCGTHLPSATRPQAPPPPARAPPPCRAPRFRDASARIDGTWGRIEGFVACRESSHHSGSSVHPPPPPPPPPDAAAAVAALRRASSGSNADRTCAAIRSSNSGYSSPCKTPTQHASSYKAHRRGGALHGVLPTLGGQTDRDRDCPGQLGFHHLPEVHRHIARHSPPRPPVACVVQNASTGQQSAGGNRSCCPDLEVWTAHRGTRPAARGGLQPAATPAPAIPHPPDTPT